MVLKYKGYEIHADYDGERISFKYDGKGFSFGFPTKENIKKYVDQVKTEIDNNKEYKVKTILEELGFKENENG